MLLHNGNKCACAPIRHSVIVEEHYLNVKMILQKLRYSEHKCTICVDFKMVNLLLEQQGGTPKFLFSLLLGQSCYSSALGKGLAGTRRSCSRR